VKFPFFEKELNHMQELDRNQGILFVLKAGESHDMQTTHLRVNAMDYMPKLLDFLVERRLMLSYAGTRII